ncbi:transcriptional regulator, PaaX family [Brevibacterium sandarakinum]|uniref:Transcriptional regulator, PaaX family n=1 Tax=Brevibacterium sandarakinum TaxID=629680 RepID=A0A1H1M8A3_BRESA|nr:PaaX family transcriptional regulator [Brevibacterium sandarakinum]SDR82847.1 transcriptional regulator, PaaX family [Brevibacterium sandarakinum]
MTGVHDHTKRTADVGDRYRLTRISFDVISAFGCLRAQGLPGPVIVGILDEHGYSSSSVHNQLVRMVHRNLLTSEKLGRVSIYRLSERILSGFMDIAGDREAPTYEGSFHSALYSIPETARTLRDRFQYVARMLGYRQLRPGVLLSFADLSHELATQLPAVVEAGWCEFATIRPEDIEAAKRMTSRAFDLEAASGQLPPLEDALAALSLNDTRPGLGQPEMSLVRFFDIYYQVAQAVMTHPILPAELVGPEQPALRFRTLMDRCNLEYYLRFDQQLLERAGSSSTFDLIEWLPSD